MIGALGSMGDAETGGGTWASTDPNTLGGSNNRAAPNTITSGVSLNVISPWSRSDMLMAAARTSVAGSYAADRAAQGIPVPAPVAAVKAPAPPSSEGVPRELVIAGAAVVGLGVIGAVIYKLRKRR